MARSKMTDRQKADIDRRIDAYEICGLCLSALVAEGRHRPCTGCGNVTTAR